MATFTVTTISYIQGPDDDDSYDPEQVVADALKTDSSIYMVEVKRTGTLYAND